jgi:hypothetical protein
MRQRPLSDYLIGLHTFTEPALSFDGIISDAKQIISRGSLSVFIRSQVGVALVPERRHRMQDAVGAQHAHMTREANWCDLQQTFVGVAGQSSSLGSVNRENHRRLTMVKAAHVNIATSLPRMEFIRDGAEANKSNLVTLKYSFENFCAELKGYRMGNDTCLVKYSQSQNPTLISPRWDWEWAAASLAFPISVLLNLVNHNFVGTRRQVSG